MRKTNESGRSMIEMLGVLAIIGVLSVGGIAGYTIAMNQHRANETISDAMKMAVLVSSQRQLGQRGNISHFKGTSPYTLTLSNAEDPNKTFTLTAANVPAAVRTKLQGMDITAAIVEISGNDIKFTFNNDLNNNNGGASGEGQEQTPGGNCSGITPVCQTCDTDTGSYVADLEQEGSNCVTTANTAGTCQSGVCTERGDYPMPASCATTYSRCTTIYTSDGVPMGTQVLKDTGGMNQNEAISACGDRGMYSMADLGCSTVGSQCSPTTDLLVYWLSDKDSQGRPYYVYKNKLGLLTVTYAVLYSALCK